MVRNFLSACTATYDLIVHTSKTSAVVGTESRDLGLTFNPSRRGGSPERQYDIEMEEEAPPPRKYGNDGWKLGRERERHLRD